MPVTIVGNNTPTAGGVVYGDGANYVSTSAGTSGQVLLSNGSSAPSFGAVGVAGGGTGATSLTANNVLLGNGTSAVNFVAPGTNGNVLMSNGTTWTSATPSGGNWALLQTNTFSGATTIDMTGMSGTYDLYFIEGVITSTTGSFFVPSWRLINSASTVLTSSLYCGNLWGGEENTTNIRWYTDENAGRFLSSAAYYTTNIDISFNMYVNRSPSNEYQGVWGNTMSLYSTYPAPSWFSGGYRALVNLNGIRIFDTTSAWTATGTLRLWGWKKT